MSKEHEYIAGAITALAMLIVAMSNVLELTDGALAAMTSVLGAGMGWLFRGRINGASKPS